MAGGLSEWLAERFDAQRARAHLLELCDAPMQGRWPGCPGERRAADYLETVLRSLGATPLPGRVDYSDPFEVEVPELLDLPALRVHGAGGARAFEYLQDFGVNVQGAAGSGRADARTVWLGSEPMGSHLGTVRGRVAVVPVEQPSPARRQHRPPKRHLQTPPRWLNLENRPPGVPTFAGLRHTHRT